MTSDMGSREGSCASNFRLGPECFFDVSAALDEPASPAVATFSPVLSMVVTGTEASVAAAGACARASDAILTEFDDVVTLDSNSSPRPKGFLRCLASLPI